MGNAIQIFVEKLNIKVVIAAKQLDFIRQIRPKFFTHRATASVPSHFLILPAFCEPVLRLPG